MLYIALLEALTLRGLMQLVKLTLRKKVCYFGSKPQFNW